MASQTKLFEVKKRPSPFLEDIDLDTCAFCQERFSPERPARNPDKSHLGSLFGACRKRQDDIALRFLDNEQRILDGELTFAYHKDCRSTYTSIWHLERTETSSESIGSDSENTSTETPSKLQHGYETRGNACFNWETDCFVCAKRCGNKKGKRTTWSLVTADADKIYNKVLIAAYLRKDMVVLRRLFSIPGGNLQAAKARYHRGKNCLSSFINERNIRSCTSPDTSTITKEVTDQFINDVKQYIIEEQKVMTLSNIRQQCQDLLSSNRITSTCRSSILKENLKQWLPDILFIERPGLSDLVCSRMITIEDAVCQINLLSKEIEKNVEMLDWQAGGDNNNINNSTKTDEQVIHEAIGILKNRITKSTTSGPSSKQEYFSANELSLESQQKFVDPLLYKALGWLANDELYKTGSDIGESSQPHGRFLSIACDLIYLATSNITPKHLGLAVTLHHHYGSRQLIDMMSSLGYTLPYTEVRHFLTSAARHVNKCHTSASGAYKPPEIASIHQGGGFIVAAADNWDHNEHTVDGKRTTHAMTSILVQSPVGVMQNNNAELRIPRAKEATLNEGDVANFDLAKVEHYKKPKVRPEPAFSPPARVDEILPSSDDPVIHQANILEMVYNMVRSGVFHCTNQNQGISSIPPWGPFHASLSSAANVKSTVAYTPILMAQPSDWSTVYTTLLKLKDSLSSLGQQYAPIYFDMGLLRKALEVTWAKPEELSGVIPCDGGMHLLMSVFGAIGFLYGDAGIKQLLSESGVFAAGTVNNIMSGKDFDRALYALKILDEALSRRFYLQFANWCEDSGHTVSDDLSKLLTELESTFLQCNNKSSLLDKLHQEVTNKLLPLLKEYVADGCRRSPTFQLWNDFLTRVLRPLKVFISATRNGVWNVYHSAKAEFLPLLFAANRTNYARYMPVVLLLMNRLPPEIAAKFQEGGFVARLSDRHFNATWLDYTLETTENKDLKGPGGIIGLTLRDSALVRYFMSRPVTARYAAKFKDTVTRRKESSINHHECGKSAQRRWNKDVSRLSSMFDECYIDPFDLRDPPPSLVNFASGVSATRDIEKSLIGALDKGFAMAKQFVAERFVPDPETNKPKKSLYDVIPRSKIQTMSQLHKRVKIHDKSVPMDAEVMYLRLLAVNAQKKVPMARLMSFENSPVPQSLFTPEGVIRGCQKSDFMHKLEGLLVPDHVPTDEEPKTDHAIIFDGHAVIQVLGCSPSATGVINFKKMAEIFLSHILKNSTNSKVIHIVFDKYTDKSTKSQTREKRSDGSAGHEYHLKPEMKVPGNWQLFLSNSRNKARLAEFYTTYAMQQGPLIIQNHQSLYISGGRPDDETVLVTSNHQRIQYIPDLKSNQEEADTRMILHAVHAADTGYRCIVISSPDTDVLVLLLHHFPEIHADNIFFLTGREGKNTDLKRYIPVHHIYHQLTQTQRDLLLPVYCLTGCDTVSSFFNRGKKTAFKLLMQEQTKVKKYANMASMGSSMHLTTPEYQAATRFVGAMYGNHSCNSLNELRCQKASKQSPRTLPPTEDSFRLHLLRCIYQLNIWRRAIAQMHCLPPATQFGYEVSEDGSCTATMMSQTPAAPELLNDLICKCDGTSECKLKCPCYDNGQCCTAACSCTHTGEDSCGNPFTLMVNDDGEDEEEEQEEEEES